jgi:hypothetical protein
MAGRASGGTVEVLSFDQLLRNRLELGADLQGLGDLTGRDVKDEVDHIRNLDALRGKRIEYLQSTIAQLESGFRVDLEVYREREPPGRTGSRRWQVVSMKTVGGPGVKQDEVLDLLVDAARRIVEGGDGEPPQPVVDVLPSRVVGLNTRVALDSSRSVDPDYDALVWNWCELARPGGASPVLPAGGLGRKRFEFTPVVPGTYSFALTVHEAVGNSQGGTAVAMCRATDPRATRVDIVALYPPMAVAGPSQTVVPQSRKREAVMLGGTCSSCTSAQWRQIGGPAVTLQLDKKDCGRSVEMSASGDPSPRDVRCAFLPGPPGEYTFELTGASPLGQHSDRVGFLIAPQSYVVLGPRPLHTRVGIPLHLDAGASHDSVDGDLQFQWEASSSPFPDPEQDQCFPAADYGDTSMVLRGHGPEAEFTATAATSSSRSYHARVVVKARREFAGRKLWTYACSKDAEITVEPRPWTVWVTGGADMAWMDRLRTLVRFDGGLNWMFWRNLGVRGTQVLYSYSFEHASAARPADKADDKAVIGGGFIGGSSVGPSLSFYWREKVVLRPFADLAFRVVNGERVGAGGGMDFHMQVSDVWSVVGTVDCHHSWLSRESAGKQSWETSNDFRIGVGAAFWY